MAALAAVVGVGIVSLILWEVFNDLFHPSSSGALTDWVGRAVFKLFRRSQSLFSVAGPLTVVLVILLWVAGLVLGFALMYYGSFPSGFRTSTGTIPPDGMRFVQSLYFSFETLITLGYGDLVPQWTMVRFVSASEGLIGFGMLTASVSSIVLLYPALTRMRLLALGVSTLAAAEKKTAVTVARSGAHETLFEFGRQVSNARIDLIHFPIIYYFATKDPSAAVPHWTLHLSRMADEGLADQRPAVRLAAATLDSALDDLAKVCAEKFLRIDATDRTVVFRALAKDHMTAAE